MRAARNPIQIEAHLIDKRDVRGRRYYLWHHGNYVYSVSSASGPRLTTFRDVTVQQAQDAFRDWRPTTPKRNRNPKQRAPLGRIDQATVRELRLVLARAETQGDKAAARRFRAQIRSIIAPPRKNPRRYTLRMKRDARGRFVKGGAKAVRVRSKRKPNATPDLPISVYMNGRRVGRFANLRAARTAGKVLANEYRARVSLRHA